MNLIDFSSKKFWIFDMDGTLTIPLHDFVALRKELGIPLTEDILTFINSQEMENRLVLHNRLSEIEYKIALHGKALPGCKNFLGKLVNTGCKLGIVTRNSIKNTDVTLKAADLLSYFEEDAIKTRESSLPKPSPDALHQLLSYWRASAEEAVMVGDYIHDISARVAAGMTTVFFDSHGKNEWAEFADLTVTSWKQFLNLMEK